MSTVQFSAVPFTSDKIDDVNGVIRGVSVLTAGLIARGHDLEVDAVTLSQMEACAKARKQVPVRIDHGSGAAAICGYLTNFRREGNRLKADWFLLETHERRNQILETARRMPQGVGLSASFVSPVGGEPGKARCEELISVDLVTLPAANPDGLFSARADRREPVSGVEKVRRVIGAAGKGAEVGALGGVAARLLLKRRGLKADGAATAGAALGALTAGAYQWRRDSRRDLAARVSTILFEKRAGAGRLIDATRDNVSLPVPGAEQARTVATLAKKPLARRVAIRAAKIGVGAGLGHVIGRRYGGHAGAVTGAVAGLLFANPDVRRRVYLSVQQYKKVTDL